MLNYIGYIINENGASLCGDGIGDWKEKWIVIGYEEMCGDPVFVDVDHDNYPIYTAMHGDGDWDPILILKSIKEINNFIK
ncbi:hypothetical protein [Bacillus sp. AFS088145]|uniref:hypothetical protein n=1 Tax=Bacillus sp. AFS088145 TaxID=2033514 RepID=UPI000BF8E515|nr:hypothetical protein [Bacillus sp. AFS088145]PFH90579.1 hypothetical protein COI44_03585 [Bacillus sp. AFS088145]